MPTGVKSALTRTVAVLAAVFIAVFTAGCLGGNSEQGGVWGNIRRLIGADSPAGTFSGVFSPDDGADYIPTNDMDAAKAVIEARLESQEVSGYEVSCNYSTNEITVTYPVYGDIDSFDPKQAASVIAARGLLTFCRNLDKDDVILIGDFDVKDANANYTETGDYGVYINLTESGAQKFAEATAQLVGQQISIWLDDTCLCSPTVNAAITNGSAIVTGLANAEAANSLADILNSGSLPFSLKCDSITVDK